MNKLPSRLGLPQQQGAMNGLLLIGVAALILAAAVFAFLKLKAGQEASTPTAPAAQTEESANQAAPEPIKTVNFQQAEKLSVAKDTPQQSSQSNESGDAGLFGRGGRSIPLTDGLAGGTEAAQDSRKTSADSNSMLANAVDAFDYGVLDGRVRIGVFGKAAIENYRVRVFPDEYRIEMPGDYRYVEQFDRQLNIQQFGVTSARLVRDERGMRMLIQITPSLQHKPFLIEDPHGLMVAFEPAK